MSETMAKIVNHRRLSNIFIKRFTINRSYIVLYFSKTCQFPDSCCKQESEAILGLQADYKSVIMTTPEIIKHCYLRALAYRRDDRDFIG